MIERLYLIYRKRVISPVVVWLVIIFALAIYWLTVLGKNVHMLLIIGLVYSISIIFFQLAMNSLKNKRTLHSVDKNTDYQKKYEMFLKEIDWYLAGEESSVRLYLYPDWTKYFHVYLMELVRNHGFKEITDASVLAAIIKALVVKNDSLYFVGTLLDAVEEKFHMMRTYTVKKEKNGDVSFTEKDYKKYRTYEHLENALGFDFVAERVLALLSENVTLTELEDFFEELYKCGVEQAD